MSQEIFIRGLFSGIFGLSIAWLVFSRYDNEIGSESANEDQQKYLPDIPGSLLPMFILVLGTLTAFSYGIVDAAKLTLSMCFSIFLHISVYYIILIFMIPFFRKYISARACSMLWIVPNYLYITCQSYMELPFPRIIIYAPGNIAWILFIVWLCGFLAILIWKSIEHLIFRHRVLKDSFPVTDSEILAIWENTISEARMKKPKFKLVISSNVRVPLSVGLFQRTTKVILPVQNYSPDELKLVLRHEIIHVAREDSWSKYFLVFCTAMCWFNPLMWIAMRKSAEDMELSCDETVLLNTDHNTRKRYASLLLDTAGDERGFTTCLSSSARSMRYRLKRITTPGKRHSGALVVGMVFFLLCMTSGYVALAHSNRSGADLIYKNDDYRQYPLRFVQMIEDDSHKNFKITDEEAFHEYLYGLTLSELTGNYSFTEYNIKLHCLMNAPEGTLAVTLSDHIITISTLYGDDPKTEHYYIKNSIDWDYLSTIMVASAF